MHWGAWLCEGRESQGAVVLLHLGRLPVTCPQQLHAVVTAGCCPVIAVCRPRVAGSQSPHSQACNVWSLGSRV